MRGRPHRFVVRREGKPDLLFTANTKWQKEIAEYCMELAGRYADLPYSLSKSQLFYLLIRYGFGIQYERHGEIPRYVTKLLPPEIYSEAPANVIRGDYASAEEYVLKMASEFRLRAWDRLNTHVEIVAQNYSMAEMYRWFSDAYCVHVTFVHTKSVSAHARSLISRIQQSVEAGKRPVILLVADRSYDGDHTHDRIHKEIFSEVGIKQRYYDTVRVAVTREIVESFPDKVHPSSSTMLEKIPLQRRKMLKRQNITERSDIWKHLDILDKKAGGPHFRKRYDWCLKNGLYYYPVAGVDPAFLHNLLKEELEKRIDMDIVAQIHKEENTAASVMRSSVAYAKEN